MNIVFLETEGIYYLYDGDKKILTSEGSAICTKSQELAQILLEEAQSGVEPEAGDPHSMLSYHSLYCDYMIQTQDGQGCDNQEDGVEELKELLYTDNFWGFDEPIQIRAAAVSQYLDWLPETIDKLPLHQYVAFMNMIIATGSIILPHKILHSMFSEDSFYSIDDVDMFVEDLEEYGLESGAAAFIDMDWTHDSIKSMVETFVRYYTLEEV